MSQKFLTAPLLKKLLANGRANAAAMEKTGNTIDFSPVVKFFNPCGAATWLISELDEDGDTAFGLCDLGMDCVELGSVSLRELQSVRGRLGLGIERDYWFTPRMTLSEYADEARKLGRIGA
jgi:hypothetical protein